MRKFLLLILLIALNILFMSELAIGQNVDSLVVTDSSVVESIDTIKIEPQLKIGDISDGNKSVPVHLLKLYDEEGFSIHKDDEYILPFSTRNTCGECHTYELIKDGTHFAIDKKDSSNRRGEPYIYTNHRSLTLLPLSYRGWEGTINPDSIGISPFQFLQKFGSHYTGGNISENKDIENLDNYFRWEISGKLEINCMVCHDADPAYDQAEFAKNIRNENFRWATASATSFSTVKGKANKMPDNFDPYNTNTYVDVDLRTTPPPNVEYDESKFNNDNKVFFDIKKDITKERCLFCHSTTLNNSSDKHLIEQEDVHISAGMNCVDCHSNDMSHDIIQGYSDEYKIKGNKNLHSFSCEGCHIGSLDNSLVGRYGAPKPLHEGIPPVHFEKLSCTVCHSSYLPSEESQTVKTSRSHKLGVPGPNKMPQTFPLIQSPVFVKADNGKIEPRNLLWPSYWALRNEEEILPIALDFVEENIQPYLGLDSSYNFGLWPQLADSTLVKVINNVNNSNKLAGELVFITGGRIYELADSTRISSSEYEKAEPYSWPIAHNVRPAQQSLGVNGCDDCHSLNSDFYFSEIPVISSMNNSESPRSMINFQGLNSIYQGAFSLSFYFRPILKFLLIFSCFLITAVLLSYTFSGIKSVSKYFETESQNHDKDKN